MGFQGLSIQYGRAGITLVNPSLGFKGIAINKAGTKTFIRPVSGFAGLTITKNQILGRTRVTIRRKAI